MKLKDSTGITSLLKKGNTFLKDRDYVKSKKIFLDILEIDPSHYQALNNLGVIEKRENNYDKSKAFFLRAIQSRPNFAKGFFNLGSVCLLNNDLKEAEKYFNKTIKLDASFFRAFINLGTIYAKQQSFPKAIESYKYALGIKPNSELTLANLGNVYLESMDYISAYNCFKKTLELNNNSHKANNGLGVYYSINREFNKAIPYFKKSIEIKPNLISPHVNLGLSFLSKGEFERGFDEYDWRKKRETNIYKKLKLDTPEWRGEDLNTKTLLVLDEPGYGDIIQFSRYLYKLIDDYDLNLLFRTKNKLKHFYQNSQISVFPYKKVIPSHDYHSDLLNLVKVYYKKTGNFLKENNFLPSNKVLDNKWERNLSKFTKLKVGLNWQGNKKRKQDRFRALPLKNLGSLFELSEKVQFISLQKGFGSEQIKDFHNSNLLYFIDLDTEVDREKRAFEDSIALIKQLDVIITVDTALAHLSSTLGKKTYVLLSEKSDWRWMDNSDKTYWYKNMNLYRQKELGNWNYPIGKIKQDLNKLVT